MSKTKYFPITSNRIPDIVSCPTSKSYANRALIISALKQDPIDLYDLPQALDVIDMIENLKEVGVKFHTQENKTTLINSFPDCEQAGEKVIDLCGSEGGTTVRFLLAFLSLGKRTYRIKLKGKLGERPFENYLKLLEDLGVKVEKGVNNITIQGPIDVDGKAITVDCSETTQFATALKLLSTSLDLDVTYKDLNSSERYLAMTDQVLEDLKGNSEYTTPYDASSLGYFAAYAALKQDLTISNVTSIDNLQADSMIFNVLDMIGVEHEFSTAGLTIHKVSNLDHLNPLHIDGSKCIDLVPTLSLIASFISKESSVKNIKFLVHKESDRLAGILSLLKTFSVYHKYDHQNDALYIKGIPTTPGSLTLDTEPDHRMVMIACLFVKLLGGGEVSEIPCISKSFPEFYSLFS